MASASTCKIWKNSLGVKTSKTSEVSETSEVLGAGIGNPALLARPLIAVLSSAKCPARLILKVHDYAKEIRDGETGIISGFHSPAEKEVLEVLLKGTCPIIVVLGRRLKGARIPAKWKTEIERGRMLIISPFKEYQTHVTKEISIKRNDLAARIAGRVMVVHVSEGGSLQGQIERWKEAGIQVEPLEKFAEQPAHDAGGVHESQVCQAHSRRYNNRL